MTRPPPGHAPAVILEGLATTTDGRGRTNLAPLGAVWPDARGDLGGDAFTLRPYAGSTTCANLLAVRRGVWHVTDDAALIARTAVGPAEAGTAPLPGGGVRLADCVRWVAFEVTEIAGPDDRGMHKLTARVTDRGTVRPARGLNRADFALVEGAILATRTFLLSRGELDRRLADLAPLVEKTGAAEHAAAWAALTAEIARRPTADRPRPADAATAVAPPA